MKKLLSLLCALLCLASVSLPAFANEFDLDTFDLRTPCHLTEEELEKALRHDLKGLAGAYLQAERDHGVNALFLVSVSALESGWGRHCFRQNNIFGYSRKEFDSYADCIDFVASKLAKNYLSEDGRYHNGYTVDAVNVRYNGRAAWADTVKSIFRSSLRRIAA